jgi:hypothetical protein
MAENGLDLRTWLTVIGVFALFFGFPAATIAFDARKKRRQEARASTATDPLPAPAPAGPTVTTRPSVKDGSPRSGTTELRLDR